MGRIPVIYQDAGNGKGVGLFAPCDVAPGDLIFAEMGFEFPLEDFSRPWKTGPEFETTLQFSHEIQKIQDLMQMMKSSVEDWASAKKGSISGLDYPEDTEACLMRPVRDNTYSMKTICGALYGWMSQTIPEETQRFAATLVARFLEDCFQYVKHESSKTVVSVFGLLIGLVNHACSPNAVLRVQDIENVQLQDIQPRLVILKLTASKTIKKGDEITFSYTWDVSPGVRQHHAKLLRDYKFHCKCDSCVEEANACFLFEARDAVYKLLYELKQARDGLFDLPLKLTCNMTRWIVDGSEDLEYFNMEILEALHTCFKRNADMDDHLRASYFFRAKLEMIKTYFSSEYQAYIDAEKWFQDTYTEWNAPEVCGLSNRLYNIADNDVIEKLYMLKPNLNDNAFTKREENEELREIVLAFRNINKTIRRTKEALENERLETASKATNGMTKEYCPLGAFANVALELAAAAAKKQLKSDIASGQDSRTKQELRALKIKEETARVEAAKKKKRKSAVARSRRVQHRKFDYDALSMESSDEDFTTASPIHNMRELAAIEGEKATSISSSAALNLFSPLDYAYCRPWISPFAAEDGLPKQIWCSSQLLQEVMPFAPRDVEHLLASKDGLNSKNEGFGLKMRRDSCCGRVEGTKEFLDLEEVLGSRKRAYSFGNDGGKKDWLKQAEV